MSPPVDVAAIGDLIRTIAREEMLPRFRQLAEHEISHKTPGDLVTVVDHAVEDRLSEALAARIPGSVTVGEEAVAAHAATLDRLDAEAWAWVIDPLDGTRNFWMRKPGPGSSTPWTGPATSPRGGWILPASSLWSAPG